MSVITKAAARAIADLSQGTILAVVEIAAPPERVFRAITDDVPAWWGSPDSYRTTEWKGDLRVGGAWLASGKGADGKPFSVGGTFLKVDPPRELVQTWNPKWVDGPETTLTYRLDPIPGGTRVTVRHEGFAGNPEACQSHTTGWERVLGWLDEHFREPRAAAPTVVPEPPASAPGAPRQMKGYVLGVLLKGPTYATMPPDETQALMQRHLAFIRANIEAGRFVFSSPVFGDGPIAGVSYARARTTDEVLALMREDPGVAAGRFIPEAYPVWAPDLDVVRVVY
jgi:uncharacterized protein YndB with AHSA1/START domain/uncharacterized protein YciI